MLIPVLIAVTVAVVLITIILIMRFNFRSKCGRFLNGALFNFRTIIVQNLGDGVEVQAYVSLGRKPRPSELQQSKPLKLVQKRGLGDLLDAGLPFHVGNC